LPSARADEFLQLCQDTVELDGELCVTPEFVKGLVEINMPPVGTLAELEHE